MYTTGQIFGTAVAIPRAYSEGFWMYTRTANSKCANVLCRKIAQIACVSMFPSYFLKRDVPASGVENPLKEMSVADLRMDCRPEAV